MAITSIAAINRQHAWAASRAIDVVDEGEPSLGWRAMAKREATWTTPTGPRRNAALVNQSHGPTVGVRIVVAVVAADYTKALS